MFEVRQRTYWNVRESRAEEDEEKDVDDVLLVWEAHPHFNSEEVRGALVEFDEGYEEQFFDANYR